MNRHLVQHLHVDVEEAALPRRRHRAHRRGGGAVDVGVHARVFDEFACAVMDVSGERGGAVWEEERE